MAATSTNNEVEIRILRTLIRHLSNGYTFEWFLSLRFVDLFILRVRCSVNFKERFSSSSDSKKSKNATEKRTSFAFELFKQLIEVAIKWTKNAL